MAYKTRYQKTVANSSSEAELMSASKEGKTVLYIRSVLDEILVLQRDATVLFKDNLGTVNMSHADHPTKWARHMDIKFFSLLDWVESDLLLLEPIEMAKNHSDLMTKSLRRILFHHHVDVLMGRIISDWVSIEEPDLCSCYASSETSIQ